MTKEQKKMNEHLKYLANYIEEYAVNGAIKQNNEHAEMEWVIDSIIKEANVKQEFNKNKKTITRYIVDSCDYQIQYEVRDFENGWNTALILKVINYDINNQDNETIKVYTIV